MKLIFWLAVTFIAYRFWYVPRQLRSGSTEEIPQEPESGEYAEYDEVEE